ncbi:MAG: SDR family oxidoreductase, partial [Lentisphaeria bacterium]
MSRNKVAIVTGASRGIGRVLALRLAKLRYDLVLTSRSLAELESLQEECRRLGQDALALQSDVSDENSVRGMFAQSLEHYGKIDLLVNNAGLGIFNSVLETSLADWERVLKVNLTGPFICAKAAFEHMRQRGGGTIINISSAAGLKAYAGQAAYTAS